MYGAGYNSLFLSDKLPIPAMVNFVELGIADYQKFIKISTAKGLDLSLHLARTPITERDNTQDMFVQYIHSEFFSGVISNNQIKSIGIHLIGERQDDIGKFGFSSNFVPSLRSEKQAIRFIKTMSSVTHLPTWIENANFYSNSIEEILTTWKTIANICQESNAGLIVDLSHLLIDAKNNDLDPLILLGSVPWQFLSEIHLSGLIQACNGSWHDGHSESVHKNVWDLLDICLGCLIKHDKDLVVTIEHTSPAWAMHQDTYTHDFLQLQSYISKNREMPSSKSNDSLGYATSYLKKLLKQRLPDLTNIMENKKINFNEVFDLWIKSVSQQNKRIVMTIEEVPPQERNSVTVAVEGFSNFIDQVVLKC